MTARRRPMTAIDRAFWQGVAVVLYEAAKPPGGPSEAADLATRVGASLAIFRQARVNPPDVAPFRKELRARENRGAK